MVWIIECRATDSLHKTCGNDTRLPSKQKKISHKEALDLTTRQNNREPGEKSNKKIAFQLCSTHVLFPNITNIKRQMQRQERTVLFHVNSKEEWNMFYNGVNNRVQSNRQFTQDLRQWHTTSIEAEKNISQGSIGPYNRPKQLWTGRKIEQKISLSIMFDPCVNPKHHKHKTPDAETGEIRSLPRQLQRGVEHVLRWCESSSAEQATLHKTCGNDTSLPSKQKKISHKEALDLTTRQNNREPGEKSNKKLAFQLCSTHVLFPNITSKKRQMQRQERTGHFHVNSKEEWNMFYDGVNHRVQSKRHCTRLVAMTQVFHRSREKISQGSIGPYNKLKNCKPETDFQEKFSFHICSNHELISDITSLKRQVQRQERTGQFHVNSKEEWNKLYDGEYSSAEQSTNYTRLAAMTQVFHRSRKKRLTRKHWTLQHAKTTVNREKCPSKISPLKYIWPMCYSHTSQTKNARCRDRREQVISTSTPKRSDTCFTMVWIIESRAADSLHKICGNDTSLPSKQKKISHKEALDLTTRQITVNPKQISNKNSPFIYVRTMC